MRERSAPGRPTRAGCTKDAEEVGSLRMPAVWRTMRSAGLGAVVCGVVIALAGCGSDVTRSPGGTGAGPGGGVAGVAFGGVVLAAQQPVAGAMVQIYAAGSGGRGKGAAALLDATLTTDASGHFSVPAGYRCATGATQVYMVARGGGVRSGAASNAALAEMVAAGPCSGIASGATYTVDEATTVASAWAMAQFLAADGSVGASATNATGLANAVRMAQALVNVESGTAPGVGFAASATTPVAKLNTLANLLSRCTTDGAAASCAALLRGAAAGASTDTLAAAIAIAEAPAANVPALYALAGGATAYAPALSAAPRDWMLAATYTGGGMAAQTEPTTVAIDAAGGAWVANYVGTVTALSSLGVPLFANGVTGGGLNSSYGLAIDPTGDVWAGNGASDANVNGGRGTVTKISTDGALLSGPAGFANSFSSGGFSVPVAVAIDPNGTVWVVNTQNGTVTQVNAAGQTISGGRGYGATALAFPAPIAIDANSNAWVGNTYGDTIVKISADGGQVVPVAVGSGGPQGLAIDASGFVWTANYYGNSVGRVQATTATVASGSPYTGATLTTPEAIAIDGAGGVWVGSFRGNVVTELAGSTAAVPGAVLSPAAGWAGDAGLNEPFSIAIDASGNVWISNFGGGTVTELIGVAAPVKTPLLGPVQQP